MPSNRKPSAKRKSAKGKTVASRARQKPARPVRRVRPAGLLVLRAGHLGRHRRRRHRRLLRRARCRAATTWAIPDRSPNIKIVSVDGKLLANRGMTGGEAVGLHEMSPYIPQAVIAIEDRRFYSHFGIDPIGLARAMVDELDRRPLLAGRLDADPAARQEPVPEARPHARAQGAGGAAGALAGAQAHQGPDPRNVPQPGLFRLRRLWRRGGLAPLFRQVRARRDAVGGRASRRPAEGAVAAVAGARPEGRRASARSWCSPPCATKA